VEITINLDKNVEENAQDYFEKAKKAKRKLEGAKKAIEQTKKKLKKEGAEHEKTVEKENAQQKAKQRKKEWHEKFKWFISSDDILVIAGKDSSSNETIIKKHTDPWNLVYHAEAPGSPFTVIKNDKDQEIPQTTKEEAANFTATHTKAWEKNMKSVEVNEVKPEQVTKEAKSGEYVAKGSFMIYGKRKTYDAQIDLSIGYYTKDEHKIIMAGPKRAIEKKCEEHTNLKQGTLKKGEIANKIMRKYKLATNDEILSALPPGKFDFSKQ
jgi:predicted ribosome quality control (RQC) complex YloA/Tae2 family protein